MDVGCGRKRRVQNDYKVCELSNWKNGAAISWKYRHGGGKVSPDHLEAKQAAKLTNGRGIQIQAVWCKTQGSFHPILLCPLQYVTEFRVNSSDWGIKTDFRKGVALDQGTEQGDHRAILIRTLARAKVRGPEVFVTYYGIFSTAHKVPGEYTVREKPRRICHVMEDIEGHTWEPKFV